jgi:hypothetical protein
MRLVAGGFQVSQLLALGNQLVSFVCSVSAIVAADLFVSARVWVAVAYVMLVMFHKAPLALRVESFTGACLIEREYLSITSLSLKRQSKPSVKAAFLNNRILSVAI